MNVKEAIDNEAAECAKSAEDMRNTPDRREIFWVVSIVLKGIAEKLGEADGHNDQAQRPGSTGAGRA